MLHKPRKILLLYKLSTYEHLESGLLQPSPEIHRFRMAHHRHYEALVKIEKFLHQQGIRYLKLRRRQKVRYPDFDLIITVGGDGTFLEAAQHAQRQTVLGVNSDPRLSVGQFCAANAENFHKVFPSFFEGRSNVIALDRFDIRLDGQLLPVRGLNDILVCHANPAAMSHYLLQIDRIKEEQRSSGIWIATAAGSTGAIHSAGGKVLGITRHQFQYLPRELYFGWGRPRHLTGGTLQRQKKLIVTSLMRDGVFFVDGAHQKSRLAFGQKLTVSLSRQPLLMVKP